MRYSFVAAFVAGSSASLLPRGSQAGECCFQLHTYGGAEGTVGQIYDGQNRIGGGYPPATYCIRGDQIYDQAGRGCILTPPTGQWQCDAGATGTSGAAIRPDGVVTYNGSQQFYACPVNDYGEWNIYSQDNANPGKCVSISVDTNGQCAAGPLPPPPPPPPKSTPVSPVYPSPPPYKPQPPPQQPPKPQPQCNPAHQYPAGQCCDGKTLQFYNCAPPAPSQPPKSQPQCNPAHQYPAGQCCDGKTLQFYNCAPPAPPPSPPSPPPPPPKQNPPPQGPPGYPWQPPSHPTPTPPPQSSCPANNGGDESAECDIDVDINGIKEVEVTFDADITIECKKCSNDDDDCQEKYCDQPKPSSPPPYKPKPSPQPKPSPPPPPPQPTSDCDSCDDDCDDSCSSSPPAPTPTPSCDSDKDGECYKEVPVPCPDDDDDDDTCESSD